MNPPVEAPTSRQSSPATSSPNAAERVRELLAAARDEPRPRLRPRARPPRRPARPPSHGRGRAPRARAPAPAPASRPGRARPGGRPAASSRAAKLSRPPSRFRASSRAEGERVQFRHAPGRVAPVQILVWWASTSLGLLGRGRGSSRESPTTDSGGCLRGARLRAREPLPEAADHPAHAAGRDPHARDPAALHQRVHALADRRDRRRPTSRWPTSSGPRSSAPSSSGS